MKRLFVALMIALATIFTIAPMPGAGQTSPTTYKPARTAFGHPDLQGIWQVLNSAAWDLEAHSASLGTPAGQGVVEGGPSPISRGRSRSGKRA